MHNVRAYITVVDDKYVVSVGDHKTAVSYGPAKVILTRTLHSWMEVYFTQIRPQVLMNAMPETVYKLHGLSSQYGGCKDSW